MQSCVLLLGWWRWAWRSRSHRRRRRNSTRSNLMPGKTSDPRPLRHQRSDDHAEHDGDIVALNSVSCNNRSNHVEIATTAFRPQRRARITRPFTNLAGRFRYRRGELGAGVHLDARLHTIPNASALTTANLTLIARRTEIADHR